MPPGPSCGQLPEVSAPSACRIGREGSKYGIGKFLELKYLCMGGIDRETCEQARRGLGTALDSRHGREVRRGRRRCGRVTDAARLYSTTRLGLRATGRDRL